MKYNTVYVENDGGFAFGMDRVTPFVWRFSTKRTLPKCAYTGFELSSIHPAKFDKLTSRHFHGTFNELARVLEVTPTELDSLVAAR